MTISLEEFTQDFAPEVRAEFAARMTDLAGANARGVVRVADLPQAEIEAMANGKVPEEYAHLDALLKDPQP